MICCENIVNVTNPVILWLNEIVKLHDLNIH